MEYRSASMGNWMAMNGHVVGEGLLDDLLLLLGLLLHVGEGLVPAPRAGELLLKVSNISNHLDNFLVRIGRVT